MPPKQLLDAIEAIEAEEAAQAQTEEPLPEEDTAVPEVEETAEPPEESSIAPTESAQAEEPPVKTEPALAPQPMDEADDERELLQRRIDLLDQQYKSLKGKYNEEIKRPVSEREQQIAELQRELAEAKAAQSTPKPDSNPAARYGLTPEEAEYGDLIAVMEKVAKVHASAAIPAPGSQAPVAANEGQRQEQERFFFQQLDRLVPKWEHIRGSSDFQAWCTPQISAELQQARNEHDVLSAADLFQRFELHQRHQRRAAIQAQVMPSTTPKAPPVRKPSYSEREYVALLNKSTRAALTPQERNRLTQLEQADEKGLIKPGS